jgi:recombination protein RecA
VRVTKNKIAPPFRVAEFDIMYNEGISKAGDLLDIAVEFDVVEKRGSYYYRDGESLAQGRENAKQFLREHPDVADQIEAIVREQLIPEDTPPPVTNEVEPEEDLDEDETPETQEEEPQPTPETVPTQAPSAGD